MYTTTGFVVSVNPRTNITQIVAWFSKDYRSVVEFNNLVNNTVYPNTVFFIVLGCSVVLSNALVKASTIRLKLMTPQNKSRQTNTSDHHNNDEFTTLSGVLNKKDIHVIKQVVAISISLMATVLVKSVTGLTEVLVPGFSDRGKYLRLYLIVATLCYTCTHVHAGLQLVMYYKFNSQYRRICRDILYCR
ncbi:uncharacterized protein LOC131951115 [Physella acuta]|uniref:uncharacterized protein LOC131951115 n=1 Tax=Physella acuta TaxID=109671 RepID=UPI0027DD94D1|nr:uncharacterized protein LOC131951115 [Physella acuta]